MHRGGARMCFRGRVTGRIVSASLLRAALGTGLRCLRLVGIAVQILSKQRVKFGLLRHVQLIIIGHDFVHFTPQIEREHLRCFYANFPENVMLDDFSIKPIPVRFIKNRILVQMQ